MRLVFSEYPGKYDGYRFPYQVLAKVRKGDNLAQVYLGGWLPFRSKKGWFYLARSTRVRLSRFKLSSENKRILRKTEGVSFSVMPVDQFEYSPAVQKFCKVFADETFGKNVMPTVAIRKIFQGKGNCNYVMVFRKSVGESNGENSSADGQVLGYAGVVVHGHFLHYAHPFYDVNGGRDLGMGMMVRAIQWAKDQNKQFAYLGTSYGEGGLYKTQFEGFEFFNGWKWSDNVSELKYLVRRGSEGYLLQDDNYKSRFIDGEWSEVLSDKGVNIGLK